MRGRIESGIEFRPPCALLAQVTESELPVGFEDDALTLGLTILRVRYAVPACQRILVVRPRVVLIGERVRQDDARVVALHARLVGASSKQIFASQARKGIWSWLVDELFDTTRYREKR